MYRALTNIAKRFFTNSQIYKYGFNWSPMYRRSTGKVIEVSNDLLYVKIKIPLSIKSKLPRGIISFGGANKNFGRNYVVWDKEATIKYKRSAKETVFAEFIFTKNDIKYGTHLDFFYFLKNG